MTSRDFLRTLSGPVLRDTARLSQRYPPIARYGVFGVSTWRLGWDTPSPFLSVSPVESMRSGGAIPPLKRGISAILARYPMKTWQMGAIPPSAILSRKGIARYGGVSRTGPLSANPRLATPFAGGNFPAIFSEIQFPQSATAFRIFLKCSVHYNVARWVWSQCTLDLVLLSCKPHERCGRLSSVRPGELFQSDKH